MCGILAIFGETKAEKKTLEGLKHLEYRGYDSWGIAGIEEKKINFFRSTGKISDGKLPNNFPQTKISLGHTRWATHGVVSERNTHPHFDESEKIAVVQNGILENFAEIRSKLLGRGHHFSSQTDTEVLPHLIEEFLEAGDNFLLAVKKAAEKCTGRFAFAVIYAPENKIVAVRSGSPLILGIGKENNFFLASDTPAFIKWTKTISYIDDGEILEISEQGAKIFNIKNLEEIKKRKIYLQQDFNDFDRGDHEHFMIKEILEQKKTISFAIEQDDQKIMKIAEKIKKARGTFLIGCGTTGKMAQVGEYFFAEIAGRHINSVIASEFPIFQKFLTPESLVITISQSGETADVIEAIESAKKVGTKILSILNVENSTISRISDEVVKINAGPEKAVASTKAATNQLAVLFLLAHAVAGNLSLGKKKLVEVSSEINDLLNPRFIEFLKKIAEKYAQKNDIFIIGKGENFPIALESAIKIAEVSQIHAEGFAAGELKHGPIALIEEGTPVLVLVSDDPVLEKEILSNAAEVAARGAKIIGVGSKNSEIFDDWIRVPSAGIASPILNLIPIQIFSYFLAIARNVDPDRPRNLAKSVTVK